MIHQYKSNGYNIVLDVNSGMVHVVDDLAYDMIALFETRSKKEIIKALTMKYLDSVEEYQAAEYQTAEYQASEYQAAVNQTEGNKAERNDVAENKAAVNQAEGSKEEGHKVKEAEGNKAEGNKVARNQDGSNKGYRSKEDLIKECDEVYETILSLKEEGNLFTEDIYEDYIKEFKHRKTVVKALCLHIAHDCNLACRYCFAEEGEYHGRRAFMSYEVGKKALDFLIENSGSRRNLEVDFFGGEPLMNYQVVKELVAYGRELEKLHDKKFRFTLTTNGVLLNDEIMEFANREMSNVVLSIDGRKAVNDKMRPFRNGAGSYDLILPKFLRFAESRNQTNYYVRGTFTHYALDFAEDVKHLAELGFQQISVEPVVADDDEPYALKKSDLPQLMEEYDKLAKYIVDSRKAGKWFNFFHFMIDLSGGPCVAKRLSGCGSGTEYLAVTPWGDLYPCHQFVGEEEYLLGNVFDGIQKEDIREEFRSCNVYSKDKCKDCFAKFYCSGGCAANAYKFHGNINDTYDLGCELQKKRVECAIMIKAAEADLDEE